MSMLSNVLHNLFSRPSTRVGPTPHQPPTLYRGSLEMDKSDCTYCGACGLKCPANAIEVDRKEKSLKFDMFKCVGCACCAENCKKGCIQMREAINHPSYEKPPVMVHFQEKPVEASE